MNFGKIWRLALSAFDERFIPPDDRPPSLSSSTGPNTDRGIQRSTGADASRRGWVFVSVLIVITGLTLLSQSAGLLSLISYSSDRAGWDATRNQRNQVQSELAQLQQSRGTLDAEVKSKESDRDRIAGELNQRSHELELARKALSETSAASLNSTEQRQQAVAARTAAAEG